MSVFVEIEPRHQVAEGLIAQGDLKGAAEAYRMSGYAEGLAIVGSMLWSEKENWAEALKCYVKALQLAPGTALARDIENKMYAMVSYIALG